MLYTKSSEYAIQAMLHLAENEGKGLSLVGSIAESSGIPRHFLAKLVQTLTRHHLVKSYRGRTGGIELARPAAKINLLQIVTAIDGPLPEEEMCVIGLDICSDSVACPLHSQWKHVKEDIKKALHEQNLADLATGMRKKREQLAALQE